MTSTEQEQVTILYTRDGCTVLSRVPKECPWCGVMHAWFVQRPGQPSMCYVCDGKQETTHV